MIPNAEKTVEVQSNITGESGQFTVDESALAHIMDVLTNLYSDPEGAVVREYLTNAFDAQVEAGMKPGTSSWTPIKVTTPSHFNKAYIIRDWGVGMDANDLVEIYSKYGKSTKTNSNDVVGMLGLGSKCALTYTNSFTITGWKNGVKTMAIVSKNEENIPVFHIVHEVKSDEPNGVEISVPVKDRNSFSEKTTSLLKWWTPGLVEVNGVAPAHHGLTKVHDAKVTYNVSGVETTGAAEVFLLQGHNRWSNPTSYIIMGNVPYEIDDEYVSDSLTTNGMGFAAYVPMGAVNFPPSRERLYFNPMTKKVISQISNGLFEAVAKAKYKEVADAPDHATAWRLWQDMPYAFKSTAEYKALSYKGITLTDRHKHDHMALDWDWKGNGQIAEREWIHFPTALAGALVVTDCDQSKKPTAYFKKKVRYWMQSNGHTFEEAILVDNDIDSVWFKHLTRIDADTIKAIKLPKAPASGVPRAEATYEHYRKQRDAVSGKVAVEFHDTAAIDIKGKRLAYISPADMRDTYRKSGTNGYAVMEYLPEDVVLVVLASNRFDKFKRTYPKAVRLSSMWQTLVDEHVKSITDNEYMVQKLGYNETQFLTKADLSDIDDPDIVDLANTVRNTNNSGGLARAEEMVRFGYKANLSAKMPERKDVQNLVTTRYPLINEAGSRRVRHLTLYCNAVYASEYAPKP